MKSIQAKKGQITLKGRPFAIPEPTPTDLQRIAERMRELALPTCTNPVLAVNAVAERLNPVVLAAALEIAVGKVSGGGVEPTADAVNRQYGSLEGVRFQFWYLATREESQKGLTWAEVEEMVTEADRYDLADALLVATRLPVKEKDDPKASPGGAN